VSYEYCQFTWGSDVPPCYDTAFDQGEIQIAINGFPVQVHYDQYAWNNNGASLASALADGFNVSGSPVYATVNGNVIVLTSRNNGSATNYGFSTSSWSTASWWGYPSSFSGPSFGCDPYYGSLSGGQGAQYTTVYDSGSTNISVNGHTNSIAWGQGATTPGIASALTSNINADPAAFVTASVSGSTVNLFAKLPGSSGNVPISCSASYDSGNFGGPSFGCSASGPTLSGGRDPIYDSGSVSVTVNGHTSVPASTWGTGSTLNSIAVDLAAKVNADTGAFVPATSSGGTVTLTAKTKGSISNYSLASQAVDTLTWPITIFNTGITSTGLPAGDGAVDSHYALVA